MYQVFWHVPLSWWPTSIKEQTFHKHFFRSPSEENFETQKCIAVFKIWNLEIEIQLSYRKMYDMNIIRHIRHYEWWNISMHQCAPVIQTYTHTHIYIYISSSYSSIRYHIDIESIESQEAELHRQQHGGVIIRSVKCVTAITYPFPNFNSARCNTGNA